MLLQLASNHTIKKRINNITPKAKRLLEDSKNKIFGRSAAFLLPLKQKINT